jgi:hypothetical protein
MHMANKKTQLTEGILTSIVDNFFKSLQKGIGKRYIDAAKKAGMNDDAVEIMNRIQSDWGELDKVIKKNK